MVNLSWSINISFNKKNTWKKKTKKLQIVKPRRIGHQHQVIGMSYRNPAAGGVLPHQWPYFRIDMVLLDIGLWEMNCVTHFRFWRVFGRREDKKVIEDGILIGSSKLSLKNTQALIRFSTSKDFNYLDVTRGAPAPPIKAACQEGQWRSPSKEKTHMEKKTQKTSI